MTRARSWAPLRERKMAQVSQIFLSHAEEDASVVRKIARCVRTRRLLHVVLRATVSGPCVCSIRSTRPSISPARFSSSCRGTPIQSHQVDREIILAFETRKPIMPVLDGITHELFQAQKPGWRLAISAATFVTIPLGGVAAILDRIVAGAKKLGSTPHRPSSHPSRAPPPPFQPSSAETAIEILRSSPPLRLDGGGSASSMRGCTPQNRDPTSQSVQPSSTAPLSSVAKLA